MSNLGLLMNERMELEYRLHHINNEIKKQELEKYKYLVGKCFKLDHIRYKILEIIGVCYHDQNKIDISYKALKIGNKTITTGSEQNLLIVIENNFISNEEFDNKFTEMVNYIKNNILNENN